MERNNQTTTQSTTLTAKGGTKKMGKKARNQKGFTLVEILIVVIILAILAGVVIPQFSSSSDEAKLSVLQSDLATMRGAAELYYHQHNSTYPGDKVSGVAGSADASDYFVDQLTLYTDVNGDAQPTKDATHKYGPYIKKGIPVNPFNDLNTVDVDDVQTDLTLAVPDGGEAWKFYTQTGQLFADDGAHDTY